jgi:hypothetical protein
MFPVPQQFLGAQGPHLNGIEIETAAAAPPQISLNGQSMAVAAAALQRYTLFPPDKRMIDSSQVTCNFNIIQHYTTLYNIIQLCT